jgi:peptidoglycan/xylan/chitin deacetylase (PgdA/CDA1 family)
LSRLAGEPCIEPPCDVLDPPLPTPSRFACLTYHVIGDGSSQYTVKEAQFLAHLHLLLAAGCVVEGFAQLESRLRSDESIPSRYVILTLDDGHESSMRGADLLQECGFQATFFLTRDRSQRSSGYIRESQIRELHERGFSVGTHGTTHRKLSFLPDAECAEELESSKQWLQEVIGDEVRYVAAPGGYINRSVLRHASKCGYTLIATCKERMNLIGELVGVRSIDRVNIRQHFSLQDLRHISEGNRGFYLRRQIRATVLALPKLLGA